MSDLKDAPSATEPFRFTLRRRTTRQHEALDAHPALHALMDGTLDRPGYIRLIRLFHAFYAGVDRDISEACRSFRFERFAFDYQPRTPMLHADLTALGAAPPVRPPEPQRSAIDVDSPGSLAGMLYVLEGSMLGGAVLHEATEALLGRTGVGNTYWAWCRGKGGERWAMTCRLLEALATTEETRSRMIASAAATFDAFSAQLEDWQPQGHERQGERC